MNARECLLIQNGIVVGIKSWLMAEKAKKDSPIE